MASDEVFMDIPQVENMAKSFNTFGEVLDGVSKALQAMSITLKATAWLSFGATAAASAFIERIQPNVIKARDEMRVLNGDILSAIRSYRDGDHSGSQRFSGSSAGAMGSVPGGSGASGVGQAPNGPTGGTDTAPNGSGPSGGSQSPNGSGPSGGSQSPNGSGPSGIGQVPGSGPGGARIDPSGKGLPGVDQVPGNAPVGAGSDPGGSGISGVG